LPLGFLTMPKTLNSTFKVFSNINFIPEMAWALADPDSFFLYFRKRKYCLISSSQMCLGSLLKYSRNFFTWYE
jgi:hypothetical protein